MNQQRDNIKAGLFVLGGAVLMLVCVLILSDLEHLIEGRQSVTVYYPLGDGLRGLKVGAPVTLGDESVGTVTTIRDRVESEAGGPQRVVGKVVVVSIPERYQIYDNAWVEMVVPALGSGTRLNIRSVGDGRPYDPQEALEGRLAGSLLTENLVRDMGIEDRQREQIRGIIANVEAITATIRQDLPGITAAGRKLLEDAGPLITDARAITARTNDAVDDIAELTAEVRKRATPWLERIDTITVAVERSLVSLRGLIEDKGPALGETIDNAKAITAGVKDRALDQVITALESAAVALAHFRESAGEVRALAAGQRPVIERALANAQLTTAQLKLAAIEIRRSPWRLLYEPDDHELDTDNLYDAARSFALAAGALDAAAQSLQAVSALEGGEDQVREKLAYLQAIFERFEQAEKGFWKALEDLSPPK